MTFNDLTDGNNSKNLDAIKSKEIRRLAVSVTYIFLSINLLIYAFITDTYKLVFSICALCFLLGIALLHIFPRLMEAVKWPRIIATVALLLFCTLFFFNLAAIPLLATLAISIFELLFLANVVIIASLIKSRDEKGKTLIPKLIILFIVVVALLAVMLHQKFTGDIPKKMFSDISELEAITEYTTSKTLSDPIAERIKPAPVEEFRKYVMYEGEKLELYAYVFDDARGAVNYYNVVSDIDSENESWNYSIESGTLSSGEPYCEYVIYSECLLYRISGRTRENVVGFLEILSAEFETELK